MYENMNYQNGYVNPYLQNAYGNLMQQTQQNQNTLIHGQILTANGQESIDKLQMAPNCSVLIAHATEPIIWKCVSDGLGNVTSQMFDVSIHQEKPKVDTNALEQRVAALESIIVGLGDKSNESNSRKQRSCSKQQSFDSDSAD